MKKAKEIVKASSFWHRCSSEQVINKTLSCSFIRLLKLITETHKWKYNQNKKGSVDSSGIILKSISKAKEF